MKKTNWEGIYPAATTQFSSDEQVDLEATAAHVGHLVDAGVHGMVMLGSLGENQVMAADEKRAVLRESVQRIGGRVPVLAGVAENSTAAACRYAEDAAKLGCDGLMVLPAMIYPADARETTGHLREVARATTLPIMVYNNPVAYTVDVTPEMFAELADQENLVAIKESSDDPRRITDIFNAVGERYRIFCGVDDLALEAAVLGAVGWVAGLVNAFPAETIRLWDLAQKGKWAEARELYRWFSPLLHLDVSTKLVQNIKLAQAMAGLGTETVRRPRRMLQGEERDTVVALIEKALAKRRDAAE